MTLLLGVAMASGVAFGPDHWVAWAPEQGLAVYPAGQPERRLRRLDWPSDVGAVVPWQDDFLVVLTPASGVQWLLRVTPDGEQTHVTGTGSWIVDLAPWNGALLALAAEGRVYRLASLPEGNERPVWESLARVGGGDPRAVGAIGDALYVGHRSGLAVVAPGGRALVAVAEAPVTAAAPLPGRRLVSAGMQEGRLGLSWWSSLSADHDAPVVLGTRWLDTELLGVVGDGARAWVVTASEVEDPGLPAVTVGPAPGGPWIAAAQAPEGDVLLVGDDLSLRSAELPPPAPESGAGQDVALLAELARGLSRELPVGSVHDLPMELEAWRRQRIALSREWPFDPLGTLAARRHLAAMEAPDPDYAAEVRRVTSDRLIAQLLVVLSIFAAAFGLTATLRTRALRAERRYGAYGIGANPFRADSPNDPERAPFATNKLVDDILATLDLNCVVVEGAAYSGKSALLRHIAWRAEQEGLGGRPVRVVRVGLEEVSERDFWTRVGRAIAEAVPEAEVAAELAAEPELDRDAVEYLLDELAEEHPRLLLCLDDLDRLGTYRHESQRFRGLVQIVPSHRMAILGTGVSIRAGFSDHEDESPWFNLFQVRALRPMTVHELATYLENRLSPTFSAAPGVAPRLHELTRGRALQVWHLAYAGVERALADGRVRVEVRDVDEAAEELRSRAGVFGAQDQVLAEDREEAWEAVVAQVAAARRRRDELRDLLGTR